MGFGEIFKKKKIEVGSPQRPAGPPLRRPMPNMSPRPAPGGGFGRPVPLVEKIKTLSRQGISEPDIVRNLRVEGHSSLEIDRALRDSLKSGIGEPELPVRERSISEIRPMREPGDELRLPELPARPIHGKSIPERPKPFPTIGFGRPGGSRETEELIEVTVEEKWKEAGEKIRAVESKFSDFEDRIKSLEDSIEDLRKNEEKKDVEVSAKIDTYKESVGEMAGKMEGLESALKSALESVLESNRNLAESVRNLKDRNK